MGFTPLEGLTMATRSGNIDPGAMLYLGQKLRLTHGQLNDYLNTKSGLLGLSQSSSDIRELLKKEFGEDKNAILALNHFAYQIRKYIGAYAAILGGLDMLIFTGTVGLRSAPIREKVCLGLEHLKIILDKEKNNDTQGIEGTIEAHQSIPILVGRTDEMKIIASETNKLISK